MEYDHLNYTPPANKWKTHYHRMTNGTPAQSAPVPAPRATSPGPAPPIPPLPKLNVAPALPKENDEAACLTQNHDNESP